MLICHINVIAVPISASEVTDETTGNCFDSSCSHVFFWLCDVVDPTIERVDKWLKKKRSDKR